MTEPVRRETNENGAGDQPGTAAPRVASGAAALHELYEQGHVADIDRHFASLVADLDGRAGPELPLAAALASAWTRDGHACIALPEVAGRDWPRGGGVRLPALNSWIEALETSPMVARPGRADRRPLVLDARGRLYLERLWTAEQTVAAGLLALSESEASMPDAESGADEPAERDRGRGETVQPKPGPEGLEAALDRLISDTPSEARARAAARTAAYRRLCVVSGGPGTGKTTVAAAIVALLVELRLAAPGRIALAAPTGKAAARLQEAVRERHRVLASRVPALEVFEARATTVHRWLFSRDRERLPIDALVLDEGSMVDVTLMAKVLAALPDGARLVVLGDASQLASVQPGAVFADVCRAGAESTGTDSAVGTEAEFQTGAGRSERVAAAGADAGGPDAGDAEAGDAEAGGADAGGADAGGVDAGGADAGGADAGGADLGSVETGRSAVRAPSPLAPCVVELVHNWRFDESGGIGRLAAAVVRGDSSAAVAALGDPSDDSIELRSLPDSDRFERLATTIADERFAPALREMQANREPVGEAGPLSAFRVLCAHRIGSFGAERFNRLVERRLRTLGLVPATEAFYPGRPILVTRNDPRTGLSNGDTGFVVRDANHRIRVRFPELRDAEAQPRLVTPSRLPPHESFFAVTVHRAQGSEYDEVAVALGPAESRIATRELLYTAVTRARRRVVVYGSEESVAAAVERATERSSGLREALRVGRGPVRAGTREARLDGSEPQ